MAIAVCIEAGQPRLLLSTFLQTCADGDRLSFEPYRVAAEMAANSEADRSTEAAAAVAEGRKRQGEAAARNLRDIFDQLREQGHDMRGAALLVNRAGWITDLLDYSLAWPEHIPVAESLSVRDALRFGIGRCGLALAELDEKGLADRGAQALGLSSEQIDARLKAFGAAAGRPWRKEQKIACLAAWIAIEEIAATS